MKARIALLAVSFATFLVAGCVSSPPTETLPADPESQAASLAGEIVRRLTHDPYFMRHLDSWTIQNHGEKPRIVVVPGTHRSPFRENKVSEGLGARLASALARSELFSDCSIWTDALSDETAAKAPDSDFTMSLMAFAVQVNEKTMDTYASAVVDAKTHRDVWSGSVQVITENGVSRMVK